MGELPMKVLLVDDESYMTEYLKKLVDWKSYGFEEVLTASGGSIARDLIMDFSLLSPLEFFVDPKNVDGRNN